MKFVSNPKIKLIVAGEFYEDSLSYLKLIEDSKLADKIIDKYKV